MSTKTKTLSNALGACGTEEVMRAIATLSALDKGQLTSVSEYLHQCTQSDSVEMTSVVTTMHSSIDISLATMAYEHEHSIAGFHGVLAAQEKIVLRQDEAITVSIENPSTDIVVGFVAHYEPTNPKSFRVIFTVTLTVIGFDSDMKFQAQVYVDDYMAKSYSIWLTEVVTQCRSEWSHDPSFSSSTRILDVEKHTSDLLSNPSEVTLNKTRNYFALLQHFLGDFKRVPGSYTSLQVQHHVEHLRSELVSMYGIKQTVNRDLVDCLYGLSDLLGFSNTTDCIVIENVCVKRNNSATVILVKDGDGWIRGDRSHMAYKRLALSKKLQQ